MRLTLAASIAGLVTGDLDAVSGTYPVSIRVGAKGEMVSIKPENLQIVPGTSPSASPTASEAAQKAAAFAGAGVSSGLEAFGGGLAGFGKRAKQQAAAA